VYRLTVFTMWGTARLSPPEPSEQQYEEMMAKGMNRGNREPKKPKSKKTSTGPAVSLLSPKGMSAQPALPKKKS
jgi:hypothetical protein